MQALSDIATLRSALARERTGHKSEPAAKIGLVPTMGALHDGHLALIEQSVRECDLTVVSIFVNPLQFGANEDLDRYPRPIANDLAAAKQAGADYVFAPSVSEMYPDGAVLTKLAISVLADRWEGAVRPGHFDGMATVVAKLFNIVGPDVAYFGEKDWQQLTIIKQMVKDLNVPVEIVACPTVRDSDGLALSSRNAYLSPEERKAASLIPAGIQAALRAIHDGEQSTEKVAAHIKSVWKQNDLIEPVYAACVDERLNPVDVIDKAERILFAVQVGDTKLIDNVAVSQPLFGDIK